MRDEDLVDNWCFELDLEQEGWLGNGDFGNAYAITDNKVIKITSDYNEFIETFNLLHKPLDFHPIIYDMRVFPTGELGIIMEQVVTDGIEDLFSELSAFAEEQKITIPEIDLDNETNLSEEAKKMLLDICNAGLELRLNNHVGSDIHEGNIGINQKGNYVLFDQTLKTYRNEYNEDVFNDIKEKLLSSYDIDEDNPIIKKDICISKILVNRDSMHKTLSNISKGKISKTNGHLECMYNSDGLLQLTDGHHRLCERLLQSHETVSVSIVFDERSGYPNQAYKKIELEDSLKLTPDEVYGGLEDLADGDTLEDYLAGYKKAKSKTKRRRSFQP